MDHIVGHDQRKHNLLGHLARKAEDQGFSPSDARRRAELGWELDQLLTDKLWIEPQGLAREGYPVGTDSRINDGTLSNDDLAVVVERVRELPKWRPDEPPPPKLYFRHGRGPDEHGLGLSP